MSMAGAENTVQTARRHPFVRATVMLAILGVLSGCATTYVDQRSRSSHFIDGQFRNGIESEKTLWFFLTTDYEIWPDWVESTYGPKPEERINGNTIQVTYINHATVLIQTGGYNVLTDPIYSERCSPVSFLGPMRVRNPGIRFEELPKIDAVIISHDHYDRLDLPTITRLVDRDDPKIYLGLGVGKRLNSMHNVKELDWWERVDVAGGFSITFVPVQHFSGKTPFDRFSTLWGGYVLEIGERKIYFGGDSGYANHYKQTFERFGPMDLSLLPVGGYAPRDFMGFAHLDPKQAVQAHLDLKSRKSIGIHHGTFQLTQEAINEPIQLLLKERKAVGLKYREFVTPAFGRAVVLQATTVD